MSVKGGETEADGADQRWETDQMRDGKLIKSANSQGIVSVKGETNQR